MFYLNKKSKYPTEIQVEIWKLNRDKKSGRIIAKEKEVSPAFVSKTLKEANKRIQDLIANQANSNKIRVDLLDVELGYAIGYSKMLNVKAYITFSPMNGVQVWYEHKGDCASCELLNTCRNVLIQEFKERGIKIENDTLAPTDLGEILFQELEDLKNVEK